jgi:hypothetical protein
VRREYDGLHLEPLLRALRSHNGRKPYAPATDSVALLVLCDYHNLFHQFGSLATAWAALQDSYRVAPTSDSGASRQRDDLPVSAARLRIFMLNNATLAPTSLLWSPGLSTAPPTFVRASPSPPPPATFSRIILVQPATETWWWNVWAPDPTDRRTVFRPLVDRLSNALLPSNSLVTHVANTAADDALSTRRGVRASHAQQPDGWPSTTIPAAAAAAVALLVQRPAGADRRVLNERELLTALEAAVAPFGLVARLVDLSRLDTRAQMALIRRTGLLVGAHGAGLLWNLFLPQSAPVIELLNMANRNEYYANHCRWSGRPYAAWQNNDSAAEMTAGVDPLTSEPFASFRNHVRVNASAVAGLVHGLLHSSPLD